VCVCESLKCWQCPAFASPALQRRTAHCDMLGCITHSPVEHLCEQLLWQLLEQDLSPNIFRYDVVQVIKTPSPLLQSKQTHKKYRTHHIKLHTIKQEGRPGCHITPVDTSQGSIIFLRFSFSLILLLRKKKVTNFI